jgi:hypothetical protein
MRSPNTSAGGGEMAGGRRFSTPAVTAAERRRIVNKGQAIGDNYNVTVDPNVPLSVDEIENAFYAGGRQEPVAYRQQPTNRVVTPGTGMEIPGRTYTNSWDAIAQGAKKGFNYGIVEGEERIRPYSIFTDRAPAPEYNYLPAEGQAAYAAGRIAADFVGHGSRSYIWGAHPEDFLSRQGEKYLREVPKVMRLPALYGAGAVMGIASGNYNPLNFEGGGAAPEYAAVSADPDNPTVSTAPVYDMVVERGAFGRKGKILGWQEFSQARPDVSFEDYSKYKDYLYNKDENILRQATFGLAKATADGINGPELSVMGYSVTPAGAAAALGVLAGTKYLYKNRMANLL